MKRKYLIILFILINYLYAYGQDKRTDSLRDALKTEQDDTNKLKTFIILSNHLNRISEYDSAMVYAKNVYALAIRLNKKIYVENACMNIGAIYYYLSNYPKALEYDSIAQIIGQQIRDTANFGNNFGNIGLVYYCQGNYPKAFEYCSKALAMAEKDKDKSHIASEFSDLGLIYCDQGNYSQAIEYDSKALALAEEIGDKENIVNNLGNIGQMYTEQGNYKKALDYNFKALAMAQEMGDKPYILNILSNLGDIYFNQKDYPLALSYKTKGLNIAKEIGDKIDIGVILDGMGSIYQSTGDYSKAFEQYSNALTIAREVENKSDISTLLGEIGSIYTYKKIYKIAGTYLDSSLNMAKNLGEKKVIKDAYHYFSTLDSATGNYKTAFEDYKNYVIYRDSLLNDATTKKELQAQMNYDFQRKTDSAKASQDKQNLILDKKAQQQKMVLYSFVGGFILMLALALLIFIGYRQKQKANVIITRQKEEVEKQKNIVEHQKELVEEKNKDILDSITYAKRLQDAILPPLNLIKQFLPNSFVLYVPKDIVAGDFYWMERSGDTILVAAADCTGHGVPGALVSVVCSNALNRTVKEFDIIEPGKILDKVRELVLETFEKSEDNVQDGMDISLCCINTKTKEAQWSGAYNSLWYIRNNEINELEGDKQPIGKNSKPTPFNSHNLKLQKGDILYLFTDGYADQFGGPKGKKFKYKQLQELLLANSAKPMSEQKNTLESTLKTWKGSLEQVDDMLVMGIRI